jgi:hypothetical protein
MCVVQCYRTRAAGKNCPLCCYLTHTYILTYICCYVSSVHVLPSCRLQPLAVHNMCRYNMLSLMFHNNVLKCHTFCAEHALRPTQIILDCYTLKTGASHRVETSGLLSLRIQGHFPEVLNVQIKYGLNLVCVAW